MSQVRAFMSERKMRGAWLSAGCRYEDALVGAIFAEAEARAILAVSERGTWAYNGPWDGAVFGAHGAIVPRRPAASALATALAAFVGEES